jgi:3-isopropylmalate/(R)-2-methylmalate dehydratase small subunit
MKNFSGKILFLDRSDINTDEIIPAKYLTEITKQALQPFLLEDLKLEGFDPRRDIPGKQVIVTRENFGCGSSREHAPWAIETNDINLVIAPSFARIFRQNMFNCGMMAVEMPAEVIDRLFSELSGRGVQVDTDFENSKFLFKAGSKEEALSFTISPFDRELVRAGGWVDYADMKY